MRRARPKSTSTYSPTYIRIERCGDNGSTAALFSSWEAKLQDNVILGHGHETNTPVDERMTCKGKRRRQPTHVAVGAVPSDCVLQLFSKGASEVRAAGLFTTPTGWYAHHLQLRAIACELGPSIGDSTHAGKEWKQLDRHHKTLVVALKWYTQVRIAPWQASRARVPPPAAPPQPRSPSSLTRPPTTIGGRRDGGHRPPGVTQRDCWALRSNKLEQHVIAEYSSTTYTHAYIQVPVVCM